MKNKARGGFTLLEMSIVLVIIGVITGGILLGNALLISSRLQTVITDQDNYITAANNFRQTYQSLPGDFANATTVWGVNSAGCPVGGGTTGTCNGNGNGKIAASNDTTNSAFLFWQHLYLAEMISQSMSGANGPNGGSNGAAPFDAVPAVNVPAGALRGSGYAIQWEGFIPTSGDPNGVLFPGSYGNALIFGGVSSGAPPIAAILTADQAASMDTKIDDGFPATGKVRAPINGTTIASSSVSTCTTTTVPSTSVYNALGSSGAVVCILFFIPGW